MRISRMVPIFAFAAMFLHVCLSCDSSTGTECISGFPYYAQNQWATCLTEAYIQRVSKGRHECRDDLADRCYYQCMLEIYDLDEGPVYDNCRCDPSGTTLTPVTDSTLPETCLSPDGSSCNWYSDCLEKKYPCAGTSGDYAVAYAQKFCEIYNENYNGFGQTAKEWVDAVRRCLQVKLVFVLRPWEDKTCEEIRDIAFQSHAPCYLDPYRDKPSICDLPLSDWMRIFWTVKNAVVDTPWQSLKGMIDVSAGCCQRYPTCALTVDGITGGLRVVRMALAWFRGLEKRSTDTDDERSRFASLVADDVARQMGWESNGMSWFGFIPTNAGLDSSDTVVNVNIWITAKSEYDLNADGSAPIVSLIATIYALEKAVKDGRITVKVDGKKRSLKSLSSCADFQCDDTYNKIIPPDLSSSSQNRIKWMILPVQAFAIFYFI